MPTPWTPPQRDPARELRAALDEAGWRVAIAELAARHGLGDELAPFPTGSDVVWAAGEHVVKLTEPRWAPMIAAEVATLERVAGRLAVATPAPIAAGELAGWPYFVMTRVPGRPLGAAWPELDHAERLRLARELGALARALNDVAAPEERGEWPEFWARCTTDVAARHAARGASAELVAEVEPFLAEVGPLAPSGHGLLHTELLGDHVLVTERGGRVELAGLIDFADSRVGAHEYEFAAPPEFLFRGEPGLLRAFLVGHGADPARLDAQRSRELCAWSLCHQFANLPRALAAAPGPAPRSLAELAVRLFGLDEG